MEEYRILMKRNHCIKYSTIIAASIFLVVFIPAGQTTGQSLDEAKKLNSQGMQLGEKILWGD